MELISFAMAAAKLGISEADLDELVDAGTFTIHRDAGDVWLDAVEVAAHLRNEPAAGEARKPRNVAAPGTRLARVRGLRDSGVREVTATEAAGLLGVSQRQVYHLLKEGRLNGEKRRGRRRIDLMEVELYAMSQEHWARMDGRWTAYGKQPRKESHAGLALVSAATDRNRSSDATEDVIGGDMRLDSRQVAKMLAVSLTTVRRLVKQGRLPCERVLRRDPPYAKRPITRHVLSFTLADVLAAADRRDRAAWARTIPADRWNEKTAGKPFVRTNIQPPPNDILITPAEAAVMLGVRRTTISALVRRGRLFGWQTQPGKHGCRLWLSGNQVQRYANSPERLRRRAALTRGPRRPSPIGQETNEELWRMEVGLADGVQFSRRTTVDRDYGEFFNTRQAARLLGIARQTVGLLRERGRLNGYRKARTSRRGGNKWWFYRKDDVYDLLADREYLRNRDRGRRAKLTSMGLPVPGTKADWE